MSAEIEICLFAVGCGLIHAFRDRAAVVTECLVGLLIVLALLGLLGASVAYAPIDRELTADDEILVTLPI